MLHGSPSPYLLKLFARAVAQSPKKDGPEHPPTSSAPPHSSAGSFAATAASSQNGPTLPHASTVPKTVLLHDWWLVKMGKDTDDKQLAVGGCMDTGSQALRMFKSAPIIKRFDAFTLETADGITVRLQGSINNERTDSNGFPHEACTYFTDGFPYNWEAYADRYLKKHSHNQQGCHHDKDVSVCEENSQNASYGSMALDETHGCPIYFDKFKMSRVFDFLNLTHQNAADLQRNSPDPFLSAAHGQLFSSSQNEHNEKPENKCKQKPENECKQNSEHRGYSIGQENQVISSRKSCSDGSTYFADEITVQKKVIQVQENFNQDECHNYSSKGVTEIDCLLETTNKTSKITQMAKMKDILERQSFTSVFTGHSTDIQDCTATETSDKRNTSISGLQIGHSLKESSPKELNESHLSSIFSGMAKSKEKLHNTTSAIESCTSKLNFLKDRDMASSLICSSQNHIDFSHIKEPLNSKNSDACKATISTIENRTFSGDTSKGDVEGLEKTGGCKSNGVNDSHSHIENKSISPSNAVKKPLKAQYEFIAIKSEKLLCPKQVTKEYCTRSKMKRGTDIVSAGAQPFNIKAEAMVRKPSCSVKNAFDQSTSVCCSSEYLKHSGSGLSSHKSCQGNDFDSPASERPEDIVKDTCNASKCRNLGIQLKNLKSNETKCCNTALTKCGSASITHDIMRKSYLRQKDKEKLPSTKDKDNLNFNHKIPVPCIATPETVVKVERSDKLAVNDTFSYSGIENDQKTPSSGKITTISNLSISIGSSCQEPFNMKKKKDKKPPLASYIRQGPVTREGANKAFASPELLNYKRSRSGRVLVPKLDNGCQQIVYDSDGAIAGILGSPDKASYPCIGIKSEPRTRSKKQ